VETTVQKPKPKTEDSQEDEGYKPVQKPKRETKDLQDDKPVVDDTKAAENNNKMKEFMN
jgi:hypothetical protein